MTTSQNLGIALAGIGAVLLGFAYDGARASVDPLSTGVTGRFTNQTMLYGLAGIGATLGGMVLALSGRRA
jgi:hypothetical protein